MAAHRVLPIVRAFARVAFALVLCGVAPRPAHAANELTPEFRRDIAELMKLTGADSLGLQMAAQVTNIMIDQVHTLSPETPGSTIAIMREEVLGVFRDHLPELFELSAEAYAKHFAQDEVKQLIAFYRTPLGARLIRELPGLMEDLSGMGKGWGESLAPELAQRVEASVRRLDTGGKK